MNHEQEMDTKEAKEAMNSIAEALDTILNGQPPSEKKNGFVLLLFPFNDKSGLCHYISNGADRRDIVKMFQEQIKRIEELDKGNGQ